MMSPNQIRPRKRVSGRPSTALVFCPLSTTVSLSPFCAVYHTVFVTGLCRNEAADSPDGRRFLRRVLYGPEGPDVVAP